MTAAVRPSLAWLVLVPLLLVAGVGGGIAWLLHQFFQGGEDPIRFVAPAAIRVQVDRPGRYAIWHDAEGVHENRVFRNTPALPTNMILSVLGGPSNEVVTLEPAVALPRRIPDGVRHAVATCRIGWPGEYLVRASGGDEPRLLVFGPASSGSLLAAVVGCSLLNLIGWGGSLAVVIWVVAGRLKMKRVRPE